MLGGVPRVQGPRTGGWGELREDLGKSWHQKQVFPGMLLPSRDLNSAPAPHRLVTADPSVLHHFVLPYLVRHFEENVSFQEALDNGVLCKGR